MCHLYNWKAIKRGDIIAFRGGDHHHPLLWIVVEMYSNHLKQHAENTLITCKMLSFLIYRENGLTNQTWGHILRSFSSCWCVNLQACTSVLTLATSHTAGLFNYSRASHFMILLGIFSYNNLRMSLYHIITGILHIMVLKCLFWCSFFGNSI